MQHVQPYLWAHPHPQPFTLALAQPFTLALALTIHPHHRWDLSAQTNLFPFANVNPGQSLLDVHARSSQNECLLLLAACILLDSHALSYLLHAFS